MTHEVMTATPPEALVPVGRPVRNVLVTVLGPDDALVPLGAPGEITFSGVCVGRGYVNGPERTAAAFGADPFRPGERMERTGDFGRWLPSGSLEFLGRRDFFALGGGSLSALRVVAALGGLVTLADLLAAPVLRELALVAEKNGGDAPCG